MKMLIDSPVNEFLEKLSSSSPTPGGGSVAALGGAMSASLISMVCRLSEDVEELKSVLNDSEILRSELTKLVDEDAKAFDEVMKAFRMPKGSDDEKATRREAIQNALKGAAKVPLIVAGRCTHLIRLSNSTVKVCNKNAISDVGVATLLAYSSLKSAALNVEINLKSIKDEDFRNDAREELKDLRNEVDDVIETIMESVESAIS
jgi:formiminotetrahydrofolate cyclodeaminase